MADRLLLVPTELERRNLLQNLTPEVTKQFHCELCGFGPIAAAASTSLLIERLQPQLVIMAGIAGTYDVNLAAVGSAAVIQRVHCDGVGVGQESDFLSPRDVGFPQWAIADSDLFSAGENIFNALDLGVSDFAEQSELAVLSAVSVCAASANSQQVAAKRKRYPSDVVLEDMETFAVALACALTGTPLLAVRGVSNVAGDRNAANWKVDDALAAVARVVTQIYGRDFELSAPTAS